ncbi:hypothetical protein ACMFMF_007258 [Clarireedia jacksonii]
MIRCALKAYVGIDLMGELKTSRSHPTVSMRVIEYIAYCIRCIKRLGSFAGERRGYLMAAIKVLSVEHSLKLCKMLASCFYPSALMI